MKHHGDLNDFIKLKEIIDSLERRNQRVASQRYPIRGSRVQMGYPVNRETVMEMLFKMGVPNAQGLVDEAIGYFSLHGMEVNMNNLETFLKSKKIISKLDLRKK